MSQTTDDLARLAEDIGAHFERLGLSRTAGRVLGVLAVAPGPQSTTELIAALGVAKSSMSVALATLTRYGLVLREPVGARGDAYRLADDAFESVFAGKVAELAVFPDLADRGLDLTDDPDVRRRLTRIRDYYRFLLREFPRLLQRWDEERVED